VSVSNGPSKNIQNIHADGGAFVQDQWKLKRFTINLGARWDHFNTGAPAQTNPASNFTPTVTINEITDTPELERLGDADGRGLGRVRQRQDGGEGLRGAARGWTRVGHHRAEQPDL
jgi:hypothetical protein